MAKSGEVRKAERRYSLPSAARGGWRRRPLAGERAAVGIAMLAANEERFWRIQREYLERPEGDYAELLRRGEVSSPDGVDPEAWRAEIGARPARTRCRSAPAARATERSR